MMHFIRARLREDASGSQGALIRLVSENLRDRDTHFDPGKLHHLVWTLFGDDPDRKRDFVFRVEEQRGRPTVMAYAPEPPRTDGALWDVESKPFSPKLSVGDRLRFMVRVNPVKQNDNKRIDVVYDAYRDAKKQAEREGGPPPDRQAVAVGVGRSWFLERASRVMGLDVDRNDIYVGNYRNQEIGAAGRRGGARRRLSMLDLEGVATVVDPDKLVAALAKGVGRGKAYGCGMLLIARA